MDNDDTILMPSIRGSKAIRVSYQTEGSATTINRIITKATIIGRQTDCNIQFNEGGVSRHHTELYPTPLGWSIRDLDSANGTLLNGKPIKDEMAILGQNEIQLGYTGPKLWVEPIVETEQTIILPKTSNNAQLINDQATTIDRTIGNSDKKRDLSNFNKPANKNISFDRQGSGNLSSEEIHQHYFGDQENDNMGDRTRLLRKIIRRENKKQSHHHQLIISIFSLLLLAVSGIAFYQYNKLHHIQKLAVDIFYDMKTIEVQLTRSELQQKKFDYLAQIFNAKKRKQLNKMKQRYQDYLDNMNSVRLIKQVPNYKVEIIHRIARIFGETELMAPKDFVTEVNKYIELWKTSKRLPNAIKRLNKLRLKQIVVTALEKQNLPPQFLYLSLQESDFKNNSISPKTRFGYAKGLWQFIPSTAKEYGLKIGPLSTTNQYDSKDERFDFKKATDAAAQYIKDIYGNEAQASGLLVMASYNWGHNRVRKLIKKMPDNPRDRNFWQLIQKHNIPKETYDYVFYIFSAAVIGEDPKYFGFNFENPLEN